MKKFLLLLLLQVIISQALQAQTEISDDESNILIALAEKKAAVLQKDLSLTEAQTELVVAKILKYSVMAKEVLQSEIDSNEKTRQLYTIAADQKEEMRYIFTEDQYDYYKRRNSAVSIRD